MSVSILVLAAALQTAPSEPPPSLPDHRPIGPPAPAPPPLTIQRPRAPGPPPPPPFRPARARANLGTYVTNDDYPVEAIRNDEEGLTEFRLSVGANGRVTDCTILSSSGSASLDETTCRIMSRRVRFTPAVGFDGRPTEDQAVSRISWRLTGARAPRPMRAEGDSGPPPIATHRARPVAPLASYITDADFPAAARGGAAIGTSHFRLTVGPEGRVTGCGTTTASGSTVLDATACALMQRRARFTPGRDSSGSAAVDSHWGHIRWHGLDAPPVPPPR